jgi:protein-S-isoprenylcysteine O-methyltransferase Ste14
VLTILRLVDSPPVWTVAFGWLAWELARIERPFDDLLALPGYAVMGVGFLLALWALGTLMAYKTTPVPRGSPRTLVRKGPYRFSRNPIYLADLIMLAGWGVSTGQPLTALLAIPLGFLLSWRFIKGEEKALGKRFGSVYRAWSSETPRWL